MRDAVTWLLPDDAIQAISEAKLANIPLLGFDGAYLQEATTRPSLEDSWDYYNPAYPAVPNHYTHAIQFIRERRLKGLRFELVFGKVRPN